ncbi:MAG: MATE family efflux transporter [Spirochaetia bacterium]
MAQVQNNPNLMSDKERTSYRRLLAISMPLMIQGLVTTIMAMVDRIFMSLYDIEQFAAITPAFSVAFTIGAVFNGIAWFTSSMVAQYYGAGQEQKLKLPMWQVIFFSLFACVMIFLFMPFSRVIFHLFGHDENLIGYESIYMNFMLGTHMVGFFSAAIGGYFSGTGRTTVAMWAAIGGNITNIALDWWFIFGGLGLPAMGITGAGLATLLGAVVTLLISVAILLVEGYSPVGKARNLLKPQWDTDVFKRLLYFGSPAAIQLAVDTMGFSVVMLYMGKLGWAPTAAASMVLSLQLFSYLPIVNIATGCGIMVGQERGAGRLHNIPVTIKKTMLMSIGFSAILTMGMVFFPDLMIKPFSGSQELDKMIEIQKFFYPMLMVSAAWLVIDAILNVYLHSLKSLGDTMFVMISYIILIPLTMVLPAWLITEFWGNPVALYAVIVLFVLVLLVLLGLRYHAGTWKNFHVIPQEDERHEDEEFLNSSS